MSINTLTKVFKETSEYQELIKKISSNKRSVQVQIIDEAVPYIVASLREDIETPLLIICHSPEQSRRMQERITAWSDQSAITSRFSENDASAFCSFWRNILQNRSPRIFSIYRRTDRKQPEF